MLLHAAFTPSGMPPKNARGRRQSRTGLGERLLQDGLSRPASPIRGVDTSVEAPETYGDGMSTVNYVDVEFEQRGGDPENGQESTETIQPFIQDICEVSHCGCRRVSETLPQMCLASRAVLSRPCPAMRADREEVRVSAVQVGSTHMRVACPFAKQ